MSDSRYYPGRRRGTRFDQVDLRDSSRQDRDEVTGGVLDYYELRGVHGDLRHVGDRPPLEMRVRGRRRSAFWRDVWGHVRLSETGRAFRYRSNVDPSLLGRIVHRARQIWQARGCRRPSDPWSATRSRSDPERRVARAR